MQSKTLKRLLPTLEAVKERDAAAFRRLRDRAETLRAEIENLRSAVERAAAELEPSDLAGHDAFQRYRAASVVRIDALQATLRAAEAEEHAARAKLARSHGSLEGCALLAERAAAIAQTKR